MMAMPITDAMIMIGQKRLSIFWASGPLGCSVFCRLLLASLQPARTREAATATVTAAAKRGRRGFQLRDPMSPSSAARDLRGVNRSPSASRL